MLKPKSQIRRLRNGMRRALNLKKLPSGAQPYAVKGFYCYDALDYAKPVACFWGFSTWKHPHIRATFGDEYNCVFPKHLSVMLARRLKSAPGVNAFIFWGKRDKYDKLERCARERNIPIHWMEDGFLRSVRLGAERIPALSLVLDKRGIYFDAGAESDLEHLLQNHDFHADPQLIPRARKAMEKMISSALSKYNHAAVKQLGTAPGGEAAGKKRILVIGQVDEDASIRYGSESGMSSNDLLRLARAENPDAEIIYKPHPDVVAGLRKNKKHYAEVQDICTIFDRPATVAETFADIDRVYTITSLMGFEALMRGIPVTVLGLPFYAGWGLTDDRASCPRRTRSLSVEEVFAAAYILYPRYFCPLSGTPITIESALAHLAVMRQNPFRIRLNEDTGNVDTSHMQLAGWEAEALQHYPMGKILAALCEGKNPEPLLLDLSRTQAKTFMLALFPQLATWLINLYRYNDLRDAVNFYTRWFNETREAITPEEAMDFFKNLRLFARHANGRKWEIAPIYSITGNLNEKQLHALLAAQVYICHGYLEYEKAFHFLKEFNYIDKPQLWESLCKMLKSRGIRNDYTGYAHKAVHLHCANRLLEILNQKYSSLPHRFINKAYYYVLIDELPRAARIMNRMLIKVPVNPKEDYPDFKSRIWQGCRQMYFSGLIRRKSELKNIFRALLRLETARIGRKILSFSIPAISKRSFYSARFLVDNANSDHQNVIDCIAQRPGLAKGRRIARCLALAQRQIGDVNGAFETLAASNTHKKLSKQMVEDKRKIDFLYQTSKIVNAVPQPLHPKGVVFLATLNCYNSLAIVSPVLVELKKRGYAVIGLTAGILQTVGTGMPDLDSFSNCLKSGASDGRIELDWHIDWENRRVECQGINFYQGIYEHLSVSFRRMSLDFASPTVRKRIDLALKRCDYTLRCCLRIFENLTAKGFPVILLGSNIHVASYSVFRDFALAKQDPNLRFVAVNIAYENYYSNLGNKFSSSMAVLDITLHRNNRVPFLPVHERFEAWYAANMDNPEIEARAQKLIAANRSFVANDSPSRKKIEKARAEGKRVIACFGKILCDLAVPYDGGPAHTDMKDWVNHTIEILGGREDTLLLIKPHPHELRPEIALDLTEYLRDILPENLPDNVLFLGHNELNTNDIAQYLDLAILWNGTSCLELTALDVPVMMCAHFGRHDYALPLIYPESRTQYAEYISLGHYPRPDDALKHRAMAFLHYMGTREVAIPNEYSQRQVTNDKTGLPRWNKKKIEEFLRNGDPYISLAADRVLEGLKRAEEESTLRQSA